MDRDLRRGLCGHPDRGGPYPLGDESSPQDRRGGRDTIFSSYDPEWVHAELDGMVELGFNTLPVAEQHGSLTGRNEASTDRRPIAQDTGVIQLARPQPEGLGSQCASRSASTYRLTMPGSTSLEATLGRLDRIIEDACTERSHLGVFPAMYRSVTAAVLEAIRDGGFFDDDEVVEHLTIVFADLYFEAYDRYRGNRETALCWRVAFETAESPQPRMILQHLLLGMNAHINLDLGLATFEAAGDDLTVVQADFVRVNEILFQILDALQGGLGEVSPRMDLLDRLGGQWDERMMRVGLGTCRDLAWAFANRLAVGDDYPGVTSRRDADAAWVARAMLRPWSPVNLVARMVAKVESRDIVQVVASLGGSQVDLDAASRNAAADVAAIYVYDPRSGPSLYEAAHRRRMRRHVRR